METLSLLHHSSISELMNDWTEFVIYISISEPYILPAHNGSLINCNSFGDIDKKHTTLDSFKVKMCVT